MALNLWSVISIAIVKSKVDEIFREVKKSKNFPKKLICQFKNKIMMTINSWYVDLRNIAKF